MYTHTEMPNTVQTRLERRGPSIGFFLPRPRRTVLQRGEAGLLGRACGQKNYIMAIFFPPRRPTSKRGRPLGGRPLRSAVEIMSISRTLLCTHTFKCSILRICGSSEGVRRSVFSPRPKRPASKRGEAGLEAGPVVTKVI